MTQGQLVSSWVTPTEYGGPSKSFGAAQNPPQPHPDEARHSLFKARKLLVSLILPLFHHILRNAVKAHHSKQRTPKPWISLVIF